MGYKESIENREGDPDVFLQPLLQYLWAQALPKHEPIHTPYTKPTQHPKHMSIKQDTDTETHDFKTLHR